MEDICCLRAVSSRLARCSSCIEFPLIASVCSIALGYTYKRWGGKRLPILRFRQFLRPPICTAINGCCCYCNAQEGAYVSFVYMYIMLISILRLHSIFAFERRTQWAKRKYLGRLNSLCAHPCSGYFEASYKNVVFFSRIHRRSHLFPFIVNSSSVFFSLPMYRLVFTMAIYFREDFSSLQQTAVDYCCRVFPFKISISTLRAAMRTRMENEKSLTHQNGFCFLFLLASSSTMSPSSYSTNKARKTSVAFMSPPQNKMLHNNAQEKF